MDKKMITAGEADTAGATLENELLTLLAKQASRVPAVAVIVLVLIAALAVGHVHTAYWAGWLLFALTVLVLRWKVLTALPTNTWFADSRKLQIAIGLSALNGVALSLSLWFFPSLPAAERMLQTVLFVSMCTGAVATTAGYMPLFLAYLVPAFGPLMLLWVFSPGFEPSSWAEAVFSLILLLFGLLLIGLARDAWRVFHESYEIRSQRDELTRQLSAALAQAKASNSAKTRFLASASHDLRQPIHTLTLFSAALGIRDLDERTREIAGHIDVALQSLSGQLDALLDVSKIDAGLLPVNIEPVNLKRMLSRLGDEFTTLCDEKGLGFGLSSVGTGMVNTDPVLLERILRNLLANAVKYTRHGDIELTWVMQHGQHLLTISDTGQGISQAEQGRIYDEFYQINNPERDRANGLGLGLSIVKRLVTMLEIEMTLESTPGEGSCFTLCLPKNAGSEQTPTEDAKPKKARALTRETLSVLVVDDEPQVRAGMQILLSEMHFHVTCVESTAQALESVSDTPPDILVADLRLRGDDNGLQTVGALRALYADLPALILSGDTAPERLREVHDAGLKLLHKPVDSRALRSAILEACEQIQTSQ